MPPRASTLKPDDFLAEDVSGLPFGQLYRLLHSQAWAPIAFAFCCVLKGSHLITGKLNAGSAAAREREMVDAENVPALAMTAFRGLEHQLPEFDTVLFSRRKSLGLRQEYSATCLHQSGQIIAIISWSQHVNIIPGGKLDDEIKSLETISADFVSFLTDGKAITTGLIAPEHMGASELFSGAFIEMEMISSERPAAEIVARHKERIASRSLKSFDATTAVAESKEYGHKLRNYFMEKGLYRTITQGELESLVKKGAKHAATMNVYRIADDGHLIDEFSETTDYVPLQK